MSFVWLGVALCQHSRQVEYSIVSGTVSWIVIELGMSMVGVTDVVDDAMLHADVPKAA